MQRLIHQFKTGITYFSLKVHFSLNHCETLIEVACYRFLYLRLMLPTTKPNILSNYHG